MKLLLIEYIFLSDLCVVGDVLVIFFVYIVNYFIDKMNCLEFFY